MFFIPPGQSPCRNVFPLSFLPLGAKPPTKCISVCFPPPRGKAPDELFSPPPGAEPLANCFYILPFRCSSPRAEPLTKAHFHFRSPSGFHPRVHFIFLLPGAKPLTSLLFFIPRGRAPDELFFTFVSFCLSSPGTFHFLFLGAKPLTSLLLFIPRGRAPELFTILHPLCFSPPGAKPLTNLFFLPPGAKPLTNCFFLPPGQSP